MVDGVKAAFERRLAEGFVPALNAARREGGWWRNLADDRDVFVAVRAGYLNVYRKGNSLVRLDLKDGRPVGSVHYKYLLRPDVKPEYVAVVDGRPLIAAHEALFIPDLSDVGALKKAAEPYSGVEKSGVHAIIRSNPNVVDVEIAFGGVSGEGAASAPRVDFAALREGPDAIRLAFYEAKDFSNKELRAAEGPAPVVGQVERYGRLLAANRTAVEDAYRRVFEALLAMEGEGIRNEVRDRLMRAVLDGSKPFMVDPDPWLVVFGFDDDQRRGTAWAPHLADLKDRLKGRVLMKGKPAGFTAGISSPARECA